MQPLEAELRLDVSSLRGAVAQAVSQIDRLGSEGRSTGDTLQRALAEGLSTGVEQGIAQSRDEFGRFVARSKSAGEDAGDELRDGMGKAGKGAGEEAGEGLSAGIVGALAAIPFAGAVVGLGAVLGKSLMDGLQVEVRADLFAARTGLDADTVAKVGRAAGEAYANNFGETIAANMDTATAAIQSGLLDPKATQRDTQAVIEQLQGVADILGEDVPRVARSASQAIKTGLAKDWRGALDLIVKGTQGGLNVSEDLLDTVDEYGTSFRQLGLTGPEALGLLSQAVQAGARDTDIAADAFKEFSIRAQDGSTASAAAYEAIGLDAEEMSSKVAAGGRGATEVLRSVLEGIAGIEDPAERTAVAVGLFGTQAEDLAGAFAAFDFDTAVSGFGEVSGAAAGAVSTLGTNTAGALETAKRNIVLAADGIKGALAEAFAPQIESAATFVTENRAAVVGFLLDAANAALDFARSMVDAAATGIESFGGMVNTVGPQVLGLIEALLEGLDSIPLVDMSQAREDFAKTKDAAELAFSGFEETTATAAEQMRLNLITNGIDPTQDKLNELGIDQVTQAEFHDATVRLSNDIAAVGYAADGSTLQIQTSTGVIDENTEGGRKLAAQLRAVVAGMEANLDAAAAAGEGTDSLTATFEENRAALVAQLKALGYSDKAASDLADTYGAVPGLIDTAVTTPGLPAAKTNVTSFSSAIREVPTSHNTVIRATTSGVSAAERELAYLARIRTTQLKVSRINGPDEARAEGGPVWPGMGLTLVGEEGPELVLFGERGEVIPAGATRQLLSSAGTASAGEQVASAPRGGAGPVSVRVFIGDRELTDIVRVEVDDSLTAEAAALQLGSV